MSEEQTQDESKNLIEQITSQYDDPKEFKEDLKNNANDYHQVIWSEAFGAGKNEVESKLRPKLDEYKSNYESLQEEYNNNNQDDVLQKKQEKIQKLKNQVQELEGSKKEYAKNYKKDLFLEQVKTKASNRLDPTWVEGALNNPKYTDRYEVVESDNDFAIRFIDEDGAPVQGADPADKFVDLLYNNANDRIRLDSTSSTGLGNTTNTSESKPTIAWSKIESGNVTAQEQQAIENDELDIDMSR